MSSTRVRRERRYWRFDEEKVLVRHLGEWEHDWTKEI